MDDSCCYTLQIQQRACQNSILRNTDNTYTNVKPGTKIELNFGYILTFISGTSNYATISLENILFLPSTNFNIPNNSVRVFDLAAECANYRVAIIAELAPCYDSIVYGCNSDICCCNN